MNAVGRGILLSFRKMRILHQASKEPHRMHAEPRHDWYQFNPDRVNLSCQLRERLDGFKSKAGTNAGKWSHQNYRLTAEGETRLGFIRRQIGERFDEVVQENEKGGQ